MKLIGSLFVLLVLMGACVNATNGNSTAPESKTVGRFACANAVKKQLRDPDSYQFIDLAVNSAEPSTGILTFRAKNGFGGYSEGQASCNRSGDFTYAVLTNPN